MERPGANPFIYDRSITQVATPPGRLSSRSDNTVAAVSEIGETRFFPEESAELVVLNVRDWDNFQESPSKRYGRPSHKTKFSQPSYSYEPSVHSHYGTYVEPSKSSSRSTLERAEILDQVSELVKGFRKENLVVQVLELVKEFPAEKYVSGGELKKLIEEKYGLDFLIKIFTNKHTSSLLVSEGNVYFRVWLHLVASKDIKDKNLEKTYFKYCFKQFKENFQNLIIVGCEITTEIQKKFIDLHWRSKGLTLQHLEHKLMCMGSPDRKINDELKHLLQTVRNLQDQDKAYWLS